MKGFAIYKNGSVEYTGKFIEDFIILILKALSIFRWHEDDQDDVHPTAERELHEAHRLQDL